MLILAMSLSGSVVLFTILLVAVLGKRVVSSAWVYNMLRFDLLFFCLPLPKYNSWYKNVIFYIFGIQRRWDMADIASENFIGIEESGRLHINFQTYILMMWAVWVCGLLFVGIRNMYTYRQVKVLKESRRISQSNYLEIFDRAKEEVGVKKNVTLLCAVDAEMVCTLGVFQKYVIVPERGMTDEEIYYSLKHELVHVKRADVAWKYIGLLAVLLHWFNPLAYLYFGVMSVYCEQSCDDIVVENFDKATRKRYGALIVYMSQEGGLSRRKYQASLGGSKKMIERRLVNMLQSRKRNRIERVVSLLLGVVILFGGSLTVCAYENPQVVRGETTFFEISSDEEVTKAFVVGEIGYSEEEALNYRKFIGEDGVSYDLPETQNDAIERAGCLHSRVSGYVKDHRKYSDGSCKTDYYYAERCTICGEVWVKEYAHTETWTKCTHNY